RRRLGVSGGACKMLTKRLLDIALALLAITLLWLLITILALMIWVQDGVSPFCLSPRVGRGNRDFAMIKLRTMVVGADRTGASSAGQKEERVYLFRRGPGRRKVDTA